MAKKKSANKERMKTINNNIERKKSKYTLDQDEITGLEILDGTPYAQLAGEQKIPLSFKHLKELHDTNTTTR